MPTNKIEQAIDNFSKWITGVDRLQPRPKYQPVGTDEVPKEKVSTPDLERAKHNLAKIHISQENRKRVINNWQDRE